MVYEDMMVEERGGEKTKTVRCILNASLSQGNALGPASQPRGRAKGTNLQRQIT